MSNWARNMAQRAENKKANLIAAGVIKEEKVEELEEVIEWPTEEWTSKEIKEFMDVMHIEYAGSTKKADLLKLVEEAKEE